MHIHIIHYINIVFFFKLCIQSVQECDNNNHNNIIIIIIVRVGGRGHAHQFTCMMASHVVWLQLSHAACAVRAVSAASTCTRVCVRRTGSQAQQQSNKRTNDQRAAGGKGRSYGRHGSSHGSRQDRGGGGRGIH